MEQIDTKASFSIDSRYRTLKGVWKWVFELTAVGFVSLYIIGAGFGTSGEQYHVGLYLLLTFVLIGLLYRSGRNVSMSHPSLVDLVLLCLTIFAIGYWIVEYNTLANRAGAYSKLDVLVGVIALVVNKLEEALEGAEKAAKAIGHGRGEPLAGPLR